MDFSETIRAAGEVAMLVSDAGMFTCTYSIYIYIYVVSMMVTGICSCLLEELCATCCGCNCRKGNI